MIAKYSQAIRVLEHLRYEAIREHPDICPIVSGEQTCICGAETKNIEIELLYNELYGLIIDLGVDSNE